MNGRMVQQGFRLGHKVVNELVLLLQSQGVSGRSPDSNLIWALTPVVARNETIVGEKIQ